LAARPGTPLAAVKRAWSHPAALRQCTRRLAQMGIERVVCYDTAGAAQIVAHDASTDAAVCSRRAAERYGLEVLVEDVSDKEQNGTRFVHLRMADHARAQVSLAFLRTSSMTATGRLDVLTGATLLPLAGTAEYPVRMWVLGADAARLQALAPVRDVQVISLGQPAAHAGKITPPKQGTEPVVKSLPHATARRAPTVVAVDHVKAVAEKADVLQIGARNMQNFDLLRAVGRAGRPVLLKRGAGSTVDEWLGAAEYIMAAGELRVILCERGIRTFETATRNTLDVGGMLAARPLTHLPIIADPSHAAGRADLVEGLARAAWSAGADGLIV